MRNAMDVELSEVQEKLVEAYRLLEDALGGDGLAPFERRNATKALAALWQVMNGLDLDPGQVYHLGA